MKKKFLKEITANGGKYLFVVLLITAFFVGTCEYARYSFVHVLFTKEIIRGAAAHDITIIKSALLFFVPLWLITVFIAAPLFEYLYLVARNKFLYKFRVNLIGKILRKTAAGIEEKHEGDFISRVTNDVNQVEVFFNNHLQGIFVNAVVATGAIIAVLAMEWRMGIIGIVLALLSFMLQAVFAKKMGTFGRKVQEANAMLTSCLIDLKSSAFELRLFPAMRQYFLGYFRFQKEWFTNRMGQEKWVCMIAWLMTFVHTFIRGFILLILGLYVFKSPIEIVIAVPYMLFFVTFYIQQLGQILAQYRIFTASGGRIIEILDLPDEPERYPVEGVPGSKAAVEFKDVVFYYQNGMHSLKGISFKLNQGESIAFVGPRGGGKSTALKILLGLYPPFSGQISIEGKPFNAGSIAGHRQTMAYMDQAASVIRGTVLDNVALGDLSPDVEQVLQALQQAGIHDFLFHGKDGLDTLVIEGGGEFSGGQRQRLALARVFYRKASILILDEPTSSLDYESERQVIHSFNSLKGKFSAIIIAHRLETVQNVNRIYVFDNGQIVEEGSHAQLLAYNGLYARMLKSWSGSGNAGL